MNRSQLLDLCYDCYRQGINDRSYRSFALWLDERVPKKVKK